MSQPRLVIFASGTADGGGSGFEQLILQNRTGVLDANIVGVVSNHAKGGVRSIASRLGIEFFHLANAYCHAHYYKDIVRHTRAEFVALSGWMKLIEGLNPATTFNIHPGPLPRFGGKGMHGHHVHKAVLAAFQQGELTHSEVCMHFVTERYDEGPVFFRYPVAILPDDTAETLAARVNRVEHGWQAWVTNLVVHQAIMLSTDPMSTDENPIANMGWMRDERAFPFFAPQQASPATTSQGGEAS